MLNTTNQLSELQLKELELLKTISKKLDGSAPNLYPHLLTQQRYLPANFLYYDQQKLNGFLSVFFFYEDAVEIALLVSPSARRKGIATQLLHRALPLVKEHNYSRLLFSSPSHLNDKWLSALGFTYQNSEYYMERHDFKPLIDYKQPLHFRPATTEDIPVLCEMDEACFSKNQTELVPRFQHILNDRNYQILLAFDNKHPVGKAHLRWEKNSATLSDIAIVPARQGKGLGTALITHCINYALSEGKPNLSLDVETHNQKALNLYTRLGFLTQNACDYWSIEINQLLKLLKPEKTI